MRQNVAIDLTHMESLVNVACTRMVPLIPESLLHVVGEEIYVVSLEQPIVVVDGGCFRPEELVRFSFEIP